MSNYFLLIFNDLKKNLIFGSTQFCNWKYRLFIYVGVPGMLGSFPFENNPLKARPDSWQFYIIFYFIDNKSIYAQCYILTLL